MKAWKQGIIGILAIIAIVFALISCGDKDDPHTHEWGEWQSDATQHWKECTANDGAKTDVGNHTGNPCTVCGYETPATPQPKTITQSDGLAFNGTVKISTVDTYLAADWNTVVEDVKTAFNTAYNGAPPPAKPQFEDVFGGAGAEIVLVNNLSNNWEVRSNEFKTLYLKTGSIATADYLTAIARMLAEIPEVGNATPPKDRVFILLWDKTFSVNIG